MPETHAAAVTTSPSHAEESGIVGERGVNGRAGENGRAPGTTPAAAAAGTPPVPKQGEPVMFFFGANRRSGTTWLASMLNGHPEVSMRNEGWLLTATAGSAERWLDRKAFQEWAGNKASQGTYLAKMDVAEAARVAQRGMIRELVMEAVRREGWKKPEKLRYVGDKTTTHYCTKVDYLHEIFPDARYLGMVRDGRDVVVSDMFLMFRSGSYQDLPATGGAREHARRAFEFHVAGKGEPVPLFNETTLRYFVDVWANSIAGGDRARELFGPHYVQVRYEDLVSDTLGTMLSLYRWLGIDDSRALAERIVENCRFENFSGGRKRGEGDNTAEWRKGVSGDWKNHFTEDDKALFKSVAGTLLIELGYEKDLEW